MIDLHCHILPGVDDGAASEEESVRMVQIAWDSGVRGIAATPHCNVPGQFGNYASRELLERLNALRQLIQSRGIPLKLYSGMEVFVTEDFPTLLRQRKFLPLGSSRYLLMEFGFGERSRFMEQMLRSAQEQDYVPVIAHPERYYCVQDDPELLMDWCQSGYVIQLNKGSFSGMFGRPAARTAHWALREGCMHLVGSDAHSPFVRTTRMEKIWDYLADAASVEVAAFLLRENPVAILENRRVEPIMTAFG